MGFGHQLTHPLQVAFFEGAGGFHSAGILRQHVAYALRDDRIQLMGDGVKLLKGDIAQGGLLEEARAGFALFTTGVVLAADEGALKVAVDDHHRHAFRHRDGFGAQRTAVDQQRVVFFAQRRNQLIHDAAVAADELVFRLLAVEGDLRAIQRQMIQLLEHGADGDFQRG